MSNRFSFPSSYLETNVDMPRAKFEDLIADATKSGMAFVHRQVADRLDITMAAAIEWLKEKNTQAVRQPGRKARTRLSLNRVPQSTRE